MKKAVRLSTLLGLEEIKLETKIITEIQFYNAVDSYANFNKMLRNSKNFKFAYNSVKNDLARCLAIIDKYNLQEEGK